MPLQFDRHAFLDRIRQVRRETYGHGEDGVLQLAEDLGIPARAWEEFEAGAAIPDTVLLRFVCLTEAIPRWLLTGEGLPYATICWSRMNGATRAGRAPGGDVGRPGDHLLG